jgi:sugar lactone lactonase YvrE
MIGFTAASAGGAPTGAPPTPTFTTVASGLDNPRGIAIGEDGQIYVAEAGRGGLKCFDLGGGGPEAVKCPGLTGAISVITKGGGHQPIVSDLASVSGPGGFGATGPDGLSRNEEGRLYTIMASCPQQVDELVAKAGDGYFDPSVVAGAKDQLGQVIKVTGPGKFKKIAGVGDFDWKWSDLNKSTNPDFPDCNPYGILAGEHDQWVVDAATNTLDHVKSNGIVEIVANIPKPPVSDAVPTCVDRGPDGALYVGELTGGGNAPGASIVWRVDTGTKPKATVTKWAEGLTAVTGCGFGKDGTFYATEYSQDGLGGGPYTGAVVKVPPNSKAPVLVVGGLSFPNGFAATEGSIYVSNWSIAPGNTPPGAPKGEVVRIRLPNEGDD